MSESLTEIIQPLFDKEDVNNFKDKNYKKKFLDDIEKNTGKNRKSLDITFNNILKAKLEKDGISSEEFVKKRGKKFSSKLDIQSKSTEVEVNDDNKKNESDKFPKAKNPKLSPSEKKDLPLGAVAGSVNSFLGAIFEDLEELTDNEKDDIGVCLNMALGDYINTHDNARKVMGAVGVLGIYGGKIKTARKKKKDRIAKEEKPKHESETPQLTTKDQKNFEKNSKEFLEEKNKIVTDT